MGGLRGAGGAAVTLVLSVVRPGEVPVVIRGAVISLSPRVITLSLEGAPVTLENLFVWGGAVVVGGARGLGGGCFSEGGAGDGRRGAAARAV